MLDRVLKALRAEGYVVEVAKDVPALVHRFDSKPSIDVLIVDGMDELDRARVLAAARSHNVWCVYLRSKPGPSDLPSVQRDVLLTAISLETEDARIASTIALVVAARRAKTAR